MFIIYLLVSEVMGVSPSSPCLTLVPLATLGGEEETPPFSACSLGVGGGEFIDWGKPNPTSSSEPDKLKRLFTYLKGLYT